MEDLNIITSLGSSASLKMGFQGTCLMDVLIQACLHVTVGLTHIACWTARTGEEVNNTASHELFHRRFEGGQNCFQFSQSHYDATRSFDFVYYYDIMV